MTGKNILKSKYGGSLKNFRIYVLVFFVLFVAAIVLFRMYTLQVVAHEYYKDLASGQHKIFEDLIPERGEIFVKDSGEGYFPVAVNKKLGLVYAVPREIENPLETAREIASILELDEKALTEKIDNPDGWYAVIEHKVADDKIARIREKNFKGVYASPESQRFYPAGSFASQLLGFVGSDGYREKGRYGIEAFWNKELEGKEGKLEQERDTGGRWISIGERVTVPAQDGADLYLTVDHTIQYRAEMAIRKALEKFEADKGSIVVLEPHSGAVLAMASVPDFNPNEFSQVEDMSLFANPVVSHTYECGSVFKPITMASGIDAEVVESDTKYTDTGSVKEAGYTIKNSDEKAYGEQTMTQVLEKSLNTGVIFVEKQLGNLRFHEYVKNFGFGEKTDIDTIGEVSGSISGLSTLRTINAYTATFGQGISVTPLQLTSAFSVIANGGKLVQPHVAEKIAYPDGKEQFFETIEKRRVITKETSLELARMMVSVVNEGHGKRAGVPGFLVAGKTGTAQVPKEEGGGYEENKHIGSFAGFAPAYDPKFVMLVKLDNPKNVEWAESSAAPTFGEMAKFMLDYFGVEPTEEYSQKDIELFNATHDVSIYQAPKEEENPEEQPAEEKDDKKKKDKKKKKN